MRIRLSFAAVAGAALLAAACQVVLGLGHDFEVADAGEKPARCQIGAQPPPLTHADNGTGPQSLLVFSLTSLDMTGHTASGDPAGYDLDGVCACDPRDDSVNAGRAVCQPKQPPSCKDAGVDNGLFDVITQYGGVLEALGLPLRGDLDRRNECGLQSALLVLSDYNGEANDPEVNVAVFPSSGIWSDHPGGEVDAGCYHPEGLPAQRPAQHDGTDKWAARGDDITETGRPRNVFRGYVSDHRLVVDGRGSNDIAFRIIFAAHVATLSSPLLTARLVRPDGGAFYLTDGVLAGRIQVDALLKSFGYLKLRSDRHACAERDIFVPLRDTICAMADTVTPAVNDFQGRACNALSVAVQFEAEPAQIGIQRDDDSDGGPCSADLVTCP